MGRTVCDPVHSTTIKPNTDHEALREEPTNWLRSWRAQPLAALIPRIVRRGFQDLLEAEISALTGAQLHERCPDQRFTHRNYYGEQIDTTQVDYLTLAILKSQVFSVGVTSAV
jgi:transposase-like protein